jgi:hypothetical protein
MPTCYGCIFVDIQIRSSELLSDWVIDLRRFLEDLANFDIGLSQRYDLPKSPGTIFPDFNTHINVVGTQA